MIVRTLGTNEIVIGTETISAERPTVFGFLLLLALAHPRRLARTQIAAELWPSAASSDRHHRLRTLIYRCRQLGAALVSDDSVVGLADAPVIDFREYSTLPRCLADARTRADGVRCVLPGIDSMRVACVDQLDDARNMIVATLSRWMSGAIQLARRAGAWELVAQLADTARGLECANADAWLSLAEAQCLTGKRQAALHTVDEYLTSIDQDDASRHSAFDLRQRIVAEGTPSRERTPHVGQDSARQRMWSAFARAQQGRGGSVLVWGPSGIGKTRLLEEMERAVIAARSRVIRVAAQPVHTLSPLGIIRHLSACLIEEPGAVGCDPDAYQWLRQLAGPNAAAVPSSHETLFQNLTELLAALTDESLLVIVLDDAQLVHEDTWPLFRALFRWSADRRVLWILATRAIHEAELRSLPDRTVLARVPLGALDRRAAAHLLESIGAPDVHGNELFERTGGNALLLCAAAQPFDFEINERAGAAMEDSISRLTSLALAILGTTSLSGGIRAQDLSDQLSVSTRELNDTIAELLRAGMLRETPDQLRAHIAWAEALRASYPMSSPPMSAAMTAF